MRPVTIYTSNVHVFKLCSDVKLNVAHCHLTINTPLTWYMYCQHTASSCSILYQVQYRVPLKRYFLVNYPDSRHRDRSPPLPPLRLRMNECLPGAHKQEQKYYSTIEITRKSSGAIGR